MSARDHFDPASRSPAANYRQWPADCSSFELCAIALDNRGRSAQGSFRHVESAIRRRPRRTAPRTRSLDLVLRRQATPATIRSIRRCIAQEELPPEVISHFRATGYRASISLPLVDDQGRVGLLLYESSDPDFLRSAAHRNDQDPRRSGYRCHTQCPAIPRSPSHQPARTARAAQAGAASHQPQSASRSDCWNRYRSNLRLLSVADARDRRGNRRPAAYRHYRCPCRW